MIKDFLARATRTVIPQGETSRKLWLTLSIFAFIYAVCAFFVIGGMATDEAERMIYNFNNRARSLAWTLEGSARFFSKRPYPKQFLTEIAKQPGVAWIALLDEDGRIILDSNPEVIGDSLYTREELDNLAPAKYIKGRFIPDDPDVYETWAIFSPERFDKKHKTLVGTRYIFIGLDATDFNKSVDDYRRGLAVAAFLLLLSGESIFALVFYFINYSKALKKLDDAKALAEQIIKNFPAGLLAVDGEGKIIFYNSSMRRMGGWDKFSYPDTLESLSRISRLDWKSFLDKTKRGDALVERERKIMRGDISIPVSISAVALKDGTGSAAGYLFILRNLEEINILKDKLAESEKLSELGLLAAGLAHEIRNPLSSIRGYARFLNKKLESDPMARATAELLEEESLRLNRVLSDLLGYAKPQKLNASPADLSSIVEKAVALAKIDAEAKGVKIDFQRPRNETKAIVDSDRILQAVLNILLNAIQASSDGGLVSVGIKRENSAQRDDASWLLTIADEGRGMSDEEARKIFTPYFSSRPDGSGLGLPLARQIVERHGGSISVWSAPDHGAKFSIFLPVAEDDKDIDCR